MLCRVPRWPVPNKYLGCQASNEPLWYTFRMCRYNSMLKELRHHVWSTGRGFWEADTWFPPEAIPCTFSLCSFYFVPLPSIKSSSRIWLASFEYSYWVTEHGSSLRDVQYTTQSETAWTLVSTSHPVKARYRKPTVETCPLNYMWFGQWIPLTNYTENIIIYEYGMATKLVIFTGSTSRGSSTILLCSSLMHTFSTRNLFF